MEGTSLRTRVQLSILTQQIVQLFTHQSCSCIVHVSYESLRLKLCRTQPPAAKSLYSHLLGQCTTQLLFCPFTTEQPECHFKNVKPVMSLSYLKLSSHLEWNPNTVRWTASSPLLPFAQDSSHTGLFVTWTQQGHSHLRAFIWNVLSYMAGSFLSSSFPLKYLTSSARLSWLTPANEVSPLLDSP